MPFLFAAIAVLTVLMTVLPARGVIPRNALAGIRIPSTMASDEAWTQGHRAAIVPTVVAAVASVIVSVVVTVCLPPDGPIQVLIPAMVLVGGAGIGMYAAGRAAKRL